MSLLVLVFCSAVTARASDPDLLYAMGFNGTYTLPGYNGSTVPGNFLGNASLYVINATNGSVMSAMQLYEAGYFTAVSPSGTRLYSTGGYSPNLTVIDLKNLSIAAIVGFNSTPYGIVLSPDGSRVYIALPEENAVIVLDTDRYTVQNYIPLNSTPFSLALSPDGTRLFALSRLNKTVTVIFASAGQVLSIVPTGPQPTDIVYAWNGAVFVANYGNDSVYAINSTSTLIEAVIRNVTAPAFLAPGPTNESVYVTSYMGNNTTVVNATGNYTMTAGIEGNVSYGRPLIPGNYTVMFVPDSSGNIIVLNATSLSPLGKISLSIPVTAMVFVPSQANNTSNITPAIVPSPLPVTPASSGFPSVVVWNVSQATLRPTIYPVSYGTSGQGGSAPYSIPSVPYTVILPVPPKVSPSAETSGLVPAPASRDWEPPVRIGPVTPEAILAILCTFIVVLIVLCGITYLIMFRENK